MDKNRRRTPICRSPTTRLRLGTQPSLSVAASGHAGGRAVSFPLGQYGGEAPLDDLLHRHPVRKA